MSRHALACFAVLFALPACERQTPPASKPAANTPNVAETTPTATPEKTTDLPLFLQEIKSEKLLKYADVQDIEVVEVQPADPPRKWIEGKVGKPKLLVEAPHLFLTHEGPLAKGRGFVDIAESADSGSPTKASVLFDVETGEVARFDRVFALMPRLELAWGMSAGGEQVLIQADGTAVAWTTTGFEPDNADVVIHPARKQIFLVRHNDEQLESGTTKYVLWTDFTKPPPRVEQDLPFVPWAPNKLEPDTKLKSNTYRGPELSDPADINIIVRSTKTDNACARGEFLPDGSFRCTTEHDFPVGNGWRFHVAKEQMVAYHPARAEVQRFAWGDVCGGDYSARFDTATPPRAEVGCAVEGQTFSWSPTKVVRIDARNRPVGAERGRFGRLEYLPTGDDTGEHFTTTWLDLADLKLLNSQPLRVHNIRADDRWLMVEPRPDGHRQLWLLDIGAGVTSTLHAAGGCADYATVYVDGDFLTYSCLDASKVARWTEVIDARSGTRWRLPGFHWDDGWVDPDSRSFVGIRRGAVDRAEVWPLR